jgi:UDP-N-acetylglucosamine acyltransferase
MAGSQSGKIHRTAVISTDVEMAPDIEVGPYAVIEGPVQIGAGCVLGPYVHLRGPLTLGSGNRVFTGAVLGERPQHLQYKDEPTGLEIGDNNVFREHVTVHRGTAHSWKTVIGSGNYFMANSHVAHDCRVGHNCIFANGALIGGHCTIEDNVYLSGNCGVHQFVRCGRLALLSGASATTKDMPPFVIQQAINCIVGVNVVGMRRAGMQKEEIDAVHRAIHLLFFQKNLMSWAMAQVEKELGHVDAVAELLRFIRSSKRGVSGTRDRRYQEAA